MRRISIAALVLALLVVVGGPPTPTRAAVSATAAESAVIGLINNARIARGLRPLVPWTALASVAGYRAARMASLNVLSHTRPGSLSAQLRARRIPWTRYGETIGYSTGGWPLASAQAIVRSWQRSAPHWNLLMSSRFNYVGVGLAYRSANGRTFSSVVLTESPDHTAPSARMTAVSRAGDDATWAWTGSDLVLQTGTAGLRHFDLSYRVDLGPWQTIRNDTTARSITLTDRPAGHTYRLRVRATDARGNVGTWSPSMPITIP